MPGAIAEDVPSNRSRSGGILAEGSPQGRIGMGSEYHPGYCAHRLNRSHNYANNVNMHTTLLEFTVIQNIEPVQRHDPGRWCNVRVREMSGHRFVE